MGNQLSTIPPDRFRDQIFSIVLYYVAPKANSNLKFSIREKCTPDNLPMPDDPDYQRMLDFYNLHDRNVLEYVNKNILNSEENLARFYQTLIAQLRGKEDEKVKKLYEGGFSQRDSDKLTRSRLDHLDSRPKSRPRANSRERTRQPTAQRASTVQKSIPAERTATNKSHFTKTEIVRQEEPAVKSQHSAKVAVQSQHSTKKESVMPLPHKPLIPLTQVPDPSVESTRQELLNKLLEDFDDDIDSNYRPDLEGDDDFETTRPKSRSRSRSRRRARSMSRGSIDMDLIPDEYRQAMDEVHYQSRTRSRSREGSDAETLKHSRRFGKECVIQENFD